MWPRISTIVEAVLDGTHTAEANVREALKRIAEKDPEYHAIICTLEQRALARAREIDSAVSRGEQVGSLAGVPFIAKDNFLVFGAETTAASTMLKGFVPPYQSTAINKLEAAGAICVAKANLDAFAHGGSTENSDFFVTKNPHDPKRVAGGSSGGSAASVALDFTPFSLGTDTGGSIRQPASFCGVFGYKPTYGLVSRSGVVAMASSTDVIGPFTRRAEDAAIVLEVMSGRDELDGTTIERDPEPYTNLSTEIKGKKIGIIKEYFGDGLDESVNTVLRSAIDSLKTAGAVMEEVSLPSLPLALAVYYVVVPAELSSNLSRHDGQRYQYSAPQYDSLDESYELSRSQGFGAEAKRRIMIGTHVLSSGYYDAYYNKAQTVRTKLVSEFQKALETYDFLIGPVAPTPAVEIGSLSDDPLRMYLIDIMTVAANLVGIPAMSVPFGATPNGLPVGVQLMAAQCQDRALLGAAKALEGLVK